MKRIIKLLPFLVLCIIGTLIAFARNTTHHMPEILRVADSLCEVHPERAVRLLDSISHEMEASDEYVRNKYVLLIIKARDKAFKPHTDKTLKSIKKVVEFYNAHGSLDERIEAYYYMGGVYRDLHDFPQSVESYMKALGEAESAKEKIDTLLVANVCSQLSSIFYWQYNYDKALEYAQKEHQLLQTIGKDDARSIMDVASCFFPNEKVDSAFSYYMKAFDKMQKANDFERNLDILAEQFANYAQDGKLSSADTCYSLFESLVSKDSLPSNYYITKALYFKFKNMSDSAIYYYERVYESSVEKNRRSDAARNLFRLYDIAGNDAKALKYGRLYADMQDSVWNDLRLKQTADAYNQYRYRRDMEEEAAAYKRSAMLWRRSLIISALAVLAALAFLGLYLLYRKRASKAIEVKKREIMHKDEVIEEKEARLRECGEIIQQNNSVIESQEKEIQKVNARNKSLSRIKLQGHFELNAPEVYVKFRDAAGGLYKLTEEDWQELFSAVETDDPGFLVRIQERVNRFNRKKMKVCYLLKLGFTYKGVEHSMGIPRVTAYRLTKDLTLQLGDLLEAQENGLA